MKRAGIQFSRQDALVILVGILATWALWIVVPWFAAALPIVLGHFFLFCNVFLVPRRLEVIWGLIFLVHCGLRAFLTGRLDWVGVLVVQTPVTVFLVWLTVRAPGYAGVFSRMEAKE